MRIAAVQTARQIRRADSYISADACAVRRGEGRVTPTAAAVAGARPVRAPRRVLARVFAGDPRVWRLAVACALPLVALVCLDCAQPRYYDTRTARAPAPPH